MLPAEHVQHLRTHAAALLDAARAEPGAPVPSCPDWDRTQLLGHVGVVHSWVRAQLAAGPGERKGFRDAERPPEGEALYDWFEAGAQTLADGLGGLDPTETWPTWAGPRPAAWFPRRMAQETAVHRWDADPVPLDPDLAVDGIDELFELFADRLPAERFADVAPGTIHLHATDEALAEPGEWLVTFGPDGIAAEKGHAKGDVALRARASDLLLWTWNRVPTDHRFDVLGDDALARRWRELVVV
jgi:uncharacterized protein (TIGR03083 family)